MFSVEWPDILTKMIEACKGVFKLDVLALPGLSCLWAGITFQTYMLTYTLVPLGLCATLFLPVAVAYGKGLQKKSPSRWRRTLDRFWCVFGTLFGVCLFVVVCVFQLPPAVRSTSLFDSMGGYD